MKLSLVFFSIVIYIANITAQAPIDNLLQLHQQLEKIEIDKKTILSRIEEVKLSNLRQDLANTGLPALAEGEEIISHSAMSLVYSEEHEQAKWVAHIITSDVLTGQVFRSNDFRPDTKVKTGTAVEEDYFLKNLQTDGTYKYDGFGYDRGHLAPSADFRWSAKALSESYFYSNMSPQLGDFNREKWAELEGAIRSYLYRNPETQLYVCTGGVLTSGLPVIERGINKVSIPEQYWKVVVDLKNKRGIGFLMSNQKLDYPLGHYTKTIDEIEVLTGIDFFVGIDDVLEAEIEGTKVDGQWLTDVGAGDVDPIPMNLLPTRHYNTVVAAKIKGTGNEVTVCGKVVSARRSKKGNIMINLDKQYPHQIFTLFIKKEDIINFAYNPEIELVGQTVYVNGKVENVVGTAGIYLKREEDLKIK